MHLPFRSAFTHDIKHPFGPFLMGEDPPEDVLVDFVARYLWKTRDRTTREKASESQQLT